MRILDDAKLDFCDVLLLPKRSTLDSRSKVDLKRQFKFKYAKQAYNGVPIIASNMDTTGTIKMAYALEPYEMSVALHKFHTKEDLMVFFKKMPDYPTFYSMGITKDDLDAFKLFNSYDPSLPKYVCVDVANGYSIKFVEFVQRLREKYPDICIMAGNVVTGDMVHDLLLKGADIVKIGIGPGSVCTTRKMTGVGYPQLSAIIECADAAHGIENGLICGDGGITCPGDMAKAFAGGADFVMCGGLFAGYEQCEGEVVLKTEQDGFHWDFELPGIAPTYVDKRYLKFYGMSSENAMEKHYGGMASYRASEGKVVEVPYRGHVSKAAEEILGGLRSTCTYVGASKLKYLPKCATFVRVNRQLNNVFGS